MRLQAATVTREQLVKFKGILSRHGGPVPVFLHFLHPREEAVLALPRELALTPSPELVDGSQPAVRIPGPDPVTS